MITRERFALNRIIYPDIPLKDFIEMTDSCGIHYIELRNDLGNGDIIDSLTASNVKQMCDEANISIISINAIQKFNLPSNFSNAREEINQISALCNELACSFIVLCPNNEFDDKRSSSEFLRDTIEALKLYAPIFKEYKIAAYVEPLGFEECSVRTKQLAAEAIESAGFPEIYSIVHDTFHHFLGLDNKYYSDLTGLVHISGVEKVASGTPIRDELRVLVDKNDIMETKKQIHILESEGYMGLYSFEPFSASIQKLTKADLINAVNESIDYLID